MGSSFYTRNSLIWITLFLLLIPLASRATDLANGERINRVCAFCHGMYGQGTPSVLAPRLADMPEWYLKKAISDFKNHVRMDPLMMRTTGLDKMLDSDVADIAAYLSQVGITRDAAFNITTRKGSVELGKDIYQDDCKICHNKDGYGKERKDAPPLAGQHHQYIRSTIDLFRAKKRHHDNDPEDETFNDYSEDDLANIIAYISTLDNRRFRPGYSFEPRIYQSRTTRPRKEIETAFDESVMQTVDVRQTIAKMPIAESVTVDEAIEAMKSRAYDLNLRIVGEQYISREQESRGLKPLYLTVLQFCSPSESYTLVSANPLFAGYMPCRIAIVEDDKKKFWLVMFNLDIMVESKMLPPEIVETAVDINRNMLSVMASGATGEF